MTLLLSRSDVETLLTPEVCAAAIEDAFRRLAQGAVPAPGILGMQGGGGSFHVKAGFLALDRPYFAAKLNADATNGAPLALMDSMSFTALRGDADLRHRGRRRGPRREAGDRSAPARRGEGGDRHHRAGVSHRRAAPCDRSRRDEQGSGARAAGRGDRRTEGRARRRRGDHRLRLDGTGLQDVAAAIAVYKRALDARAGRPFSLSG